MFLVKGKNVGKSVFLVAGVPVDPGCSFNLEVDENHANGLKYFANRGIVRIDSLVSDEETIKPETAPEEAAEPETALEEAAEPETAPEEAAEPETAPEEAAEPETAPEEVISGLEPKPKKPKRGRKKKQED